METIHISQGNTKMGKIASISFPPLITCDPDVPCRKRCYAKRLYGLPSIKKAWDENYEIFKEDESVFWNQLAGAISALNCKMFRFFVGGDFPRKSMMENALDFAKAFPKTRFLVFTKRVNWLPLIYLVPENMTIIISMWPGYYPDSLYEGVRKENFSIYPKAWVFDKKNPDERIPKNAKKCKHNCTSCKLCWGLKTNVVFDIHT